MSLPPRSTLGHQVIVHDRWIQELFQPKHSGGCGQVAHQRHLRDRPAAAGPSPSPRSRRACSAHVSSRTVVAFAVAAATVTAVAADDGVYSFPMSNYKNVQYFLEVDVGTPPQKLRLALATTIADMSTKLEGEGASSGYNPAASSSSLNMSREVGNTSLFQDNISIGDLVFENFTFLAEKGANYSKSMGLPSVPFQGDGYFGFAFAAYMKENTGPGMPALIQGLADSGKLKEPSFAIYFGDDSPGEIVFGGVNPQHYIGSFNYVDTFHPYTSGPTWLMPLSQFKVDNEIMDLGSPASCVVEVHSVVYGPEHDVGVISSKLNATREDDLYVVPCSRSVSLTFTINGIDYVLDQDDLLLEARSDGSCVLALGTYVSAKWGTWSLGAPFMRKFYTQFDVGSQRMGIAHAARAAGRRLTVLV